MQPPTCAPVQLGPDTVETLAIVQAWGQAFDDCDLDRLLALSTLDIRLGDSEIAQGHEGLRRMLQLQSFGVAQHAHPVRYVAFGSTVAVEASLEFRWVDGGELADTAEGVAVFEVGDGRVRSFRPQPDLTAAFRIAGWPATAIPAFTSPAERRDRAKDAGRCTTGPSPRPRSTT